MGKVTFIQHLILVHPHLVSTRSKLVGEQGIA